MKRLTFLTTLLLLLGGCACTFSQIPPQYLYVDESCGAALPDYLPKFTYSDNCGIDTVWQSPTRGSWLTAPTTTVLIRAIDKFGNHTDLMFDVTLLDTIPPTITLADSTLVSKAYYDLGTMYDIADKILARQEWYFDGTFPWDDVQIQYTDSLGVLQTITGIPDELVPSNLYLNRTLVTWTAAGHAFTGDGMRVFTFAQPGDTLIVQ